MAAVAAYFSWDRAGRPLEPSRPVRDIVERMRVLFPRAAATFSWYANEAHYQANPPLDHTPFSASGWPQASPQWVVNAADVMHRPDLGVDCNTLFAYWIAEARRGAMPWLKYLIWQAKIYDVRNGWRPQTSSGHFDHVHFSVRTDHRNTSLGSWSLVPGGEDMDANQAALLSALAYRMDALMAGSDTVRGGATQGEPMWLVTAVKALQAAVAAPTPVTVDASAVAAALAGNGAFLAAVANAVNDDAAARGAE